MSTVPSGKPAICISPFLEYVLSDFRDSASARLVFDRPENQLLVGHGQVHFVPDPKTDRLDDRFRKYDGSSIAKRNNY